MTITLLMAAIARLLDGLASLGDPLQNPSLRRSSIAAATALCALACGPDRTARRPARPPLVLPTRPVLFDTAEADAILETMEIFPPDSPWNEDISARPVHPRSAAILASIGPDEPLDFNLDMGFILVPPDQPRIGVTVTDYAAESDLAPVPIPDTAPIENWPLARNEDRSALPRPGQSLEDFQTTGEGDRHVLVVDPARGQLFELLEAHRIATGWQATQVSIFDLTTNALRPAGWTSADGAGLPIFPAVVRYHEVARGLVRHAMRVTVHRTRRAYVSPARHWASKDPSPDLPCMGERLRLRRDLDLTGFPPHARAILEGLKQYGMFVADNGGDWLLSISPDRRFQGLESLSRVHGRDFEVVQPASPEQVGVRR